MEWGLDVGAVFGAGEKSWMGKIGGNGEGSACVFEVDEMRGFEGFEDSYGSQCAFEDFAINLPEYHERYLRSAYCRCLTMWRRTPQSIDSL